MRDKIDLCYHAAYENAGARWNMREVTLPALRKRLAELRQCLAKFEDVPEGMERFGEAGILREEDELTRVIAYAEARVGSEVVA